MAHRWVLCLLPASCYPSHGLTAAAVWRPGERGGVGSQTGLREDGQGRPEAGAATVGCWGGRECAQELTDESGVAERQATLHLPPDLEVYEEP